MIIKINENHETIPKTISEEKIRNQEIAEQRFRRSSTQVFRVCEIPLFHAVNFILKAVRINTGIGRNPLENRRN